MAKYSRFDPRNKKRDRNKNNYLERARRIHEERKTQPKYKNYIWEYCEDDELEDDEQW